jgi:hypothetical protein
MTEGIKKYLIKRSPDFTRNGIIVKRNQSLKGYSQGTILDMPISNKLKIGDIIYVAEKDYGIYAKGTVTKVHDIVRFNNIEEILNYYTNNKIKDASYWLEFIQRLSKEKLTNPYAVFSFQEFFINQKILEKVVTYSGELEKLKKIQVSIYEIPDSIISLIENPTTNIVNELESKIPNSLRLDLYSLFNKNYKLSTWIDIDHFVPQSIGGPGNIPENLVPVGFNLNRYKSDLIPIGLFYTARNYPLLQMYCEKYFFETKESFIKSPEITDKATKIIERVKTMDMNSIRTFFKKVLEYHHPSYIEIIENFKY